MVAIVEDTESIIEETSHPHPSSSRFRWRRDDVQPPLNKRWRKVHALALLGTSLGACWFCKSGKSDISNSESAGGDVKAAPGGRDASELLVGVGDGDGEIAITDISCSGVVL